MAEAKILQSKLGVTLIEIAVRDENGAMVDGGYLVRGGSPEFDFTGVCLQTAQARFLAAVAQAHMAEQLRSAWRLASPFRPRPKAVGFAGKAGDRNQLQSAKAALRNRVAT